MPRRWLLPCPGVLGPNVSRALGRGLGSTLRVPSSTRACRSHLSPLCSGTSSLTTSCWTSKVRGGDTGGRWTGWAGGGGPSLSPCANPAGHAHLTDFNIATIVKDGERATALAGTKPYMGELTAAQTPAQPPMVAQAPPMASQAPPMAAEAPPTVSQAPPMVAQAPPMATQALPMATQAPPTAAQAPPMTAQASSPPSRLMTCPCPCPGVPLRWGSARGWLCGWPGVHQEGEGPWARFGGAVPQQAAVPLGQLRRSSIPLSTAEQDTRLRWTGGRWE